MDPSSCIIDSAHAGPSRHHERQSLLTVCDTVRRSARCACRLGCGAGSESGPHGRRRVALETASGGYFCSSYDKKSTR